jgi:WD40 repeat protein
LKTLRGLVGQLAKVSFSPDGTRVVAVSHQMDTAVWEWPSGRLLHVFDTPKGLWADSIGVAFSHDNKQLAYSCHNRAILYDLTTGKELRTWDLPIGFVEHLAFDKANRQLMLFRVETTDPKVPPWGRTDPRKFPRVCNLRNLLGTEPLKPVKEIKAFDLHVFAAVMATDGHLVVVDGMGTSTGKRQRRVVAFNGLTGDELWSREQERTADSQLFALDPSGTILGLLVDGGTGKPETPTRLWDANSGKPLGALGGNWWASLSTGGEYWGAAHPTGFSVGRRADGKPLITLGLDTHPGRSQFHPKHTHVAWTSTDGIVIVADLLQVQRKLTELNLGW